MLDALRAVVSSMGSVLVCYSGGIDSALVLAVAHGVLGARAVAMTAVSPSLALHELDGAKAFAVELGVRHELIASGELDDPSYQANLADRCYHCKSELYRLAERYRQQWDLAYVANGTNVDDLGDFRPGLQAAEEARVRSPLVEIGAKKADVRRLAEALGLSIWDKPAAACLSSRLPFGTRVTQERLARIGAFEGDLQSLGLRQLRVRWHSVGGDTSEASLARIEVGQDELTRAFELHEAIVALGKKHGFQYVTLDLQGYRVGSHNEVLTGRTLRVLQGQ
jgi:uncharacterized protein